MSCFINMYSQTVNGAMPSLTLVNKTTFDSAKVQIFMSFLICKILQILLNESMGKLC